MIRTLVADDHEIVLEGLRSLLDAQPDIEVVGTATDGDHLLALIDAHPVDVIVTDLEMPPYNIEILDHIRGREHAARVLVLTAFSDFETIRRAIELEAEGYALKTESPRQVIEAIRQVAQGRRVYPRAAQRWLMGRGAPEANHSQPRLSPRERDVIVLLAEGLTNQQIAERLTVSENTVRFHLKNIYEKIGVNNRTEAAGWYLTRRG
ncbi:MAG: response regulator [Anaerolineae bacterium]